MTDTASRGDAHSAPIATIYQNSDQIAGVLQQIVRHPLLTEESRDFTSGGDNNRATDGSVSGKGSGKARVPFVGGGEVGLEARASLSSSWTETTGTASRQQFVYSQAYNLHLVRQHLDQKKLLTRVASVEQAEAVQLGAFVEYTTAFDPVELTLALDVLSPELVAAITRFTVKQRYLERLPTQHEARVLHAEKMNLEVEMKGELARAITNAFKADTRQDVTREYYGRVAVDPALTLITICDLAHFIVDDPDRLLDGTFTVLGKVIAPVEMDTPTLSRNKLLRNLAPAALDDGIEELYKLMNKAPEVGEKPPSEYVDLKMASRVNGASMRVMPLAIYS
ncbi:MULTISPECIES: hypothetical protein [Kocuria]|uniref:DUF6414 family protein n=1 Tax=Kocuria TaxID=57493 RepID=UPI001D6CBDC9|nr:hypothetical protein [Kocuria sp.]MBX7555682.1 hypothetical protein [Streptomyces sp. tea 10]WTI31849.1 hypothetical protein OH817_09780 [Kocuria rhizophila]